MLKGTLISTLKSRAEADIARVTGPYVPATTSVGAAGQGNYWESYSLKLGRSVRTHSDLMHDYIVLLESDCNVATYCEYPIAAGKSVRRRRVRFRVDSWVRQVDGTEHFCILEKKRTGYDGQDISLPRVPNDLTEWAALNGASIKIVLEREIRKEPYRLSNLKLILHFLRVHSKTNISGFEIEELWKGKPSITFSEAFKILGGNRPTEQTRAYLLTLIVRGGLSADLSLGPLTDATVLRRGTAI